MIYTTTPELLKHIKHIKLDKDISNIELSKKLNCTPASVSNSFSQKNITLDKLNDICNALNCDLEINFIDRESQEPI